MHCKEGVENLIKQGPPRGGDLVLQLFSVHLCRLDDKNSGGERILMYLATSRVSVYLFTRFCISTQKARGELFIQFVQERDAITRLVNRLKISEHTRHAFFLDRVYPWWSQICSHDNQSTYVCFCFLLSLLLSCALDHRSLSIHYPCLDSGLV